MYPRNAASPPRIYVGPVVQISDGAVQTASVTVTVTPEGGSETGSAGTVAYSAKGGVWYTPTQAETNYTAFVIEAWKTGCLPAGVTVVTTAGATAGIAVCANTQKVDVETIKTATVAASSTVTFANGTIYTGTPPSAATIAQAVWDALTSALTTASSIGKYILDHVVGTLATGSHVAQTGDSYARIGVAGASLTALPQLPALALTTSTVHADGANTASSFQTHLTEADNYWNDALILITSGALIGQVKEIGDFGNTGGVITLTSGQAFTAIPADNVTFCIINR